MVPSFLFPKLSCTSLLFALFSSLLKDLENLMHWYSWMQLSFPKRKCRVIGWMPECGSTASHLTVVLTFRAASSAPRSAPESLLEPSCCCDGHSRTGVLCLAPGLSIIRFSSDRPWPCPIPPLKIFLFTFLFLARFLHPLHAFPSYYES